MTAREPVGIVGSGDIGQALARNAIRAGFPVAAVTAAARTMMHDLHDHHLRVDRMAAIANSALDTAP